MNTDFVTDLARKLAANVPGGVRAAQADLERNFEALLQGAFSRLDLVTREEFEIQRRVLERTREKLARLEADLARLEGADGRA
jgi:BMFP domain-containing protein YqiC